MDFAFHVFEEFKKLNLTPPDHCHNFESVKSATDYFMYLCTDRAQTGKKRISLMQRGAMEALVGINAMLMGIFSGPLLRGPKEVEFLVRGPIYKELEDAGGSLGDASIQELFNSYCLAEKQVLATTATCATVEDKTE